MKKFYFILQVVYLLFVCTTFGQISSWKIAGESNTISSIISDDGTEFVTGSYSLKLMMISKYPKSISHDSAAIVVLRCPIKKITKQKNLYVSVKIANIKKTQNSYFQFGCSQELNSENSQSIWTPDYTNNVIDIIGIGNWKNYEFKNFTPSPINDSTTAVDIFIRTNADTIELNFDDLSNDEKILESFENPQIISTTKIGDWSITKSTDILSAKISQNTSEMINFDPNTKGYVEGKGSLQIEYVNLAGLKGNCSISKTFPGGVSFPKYVGFACKCITFSPLTSYVYYLDKMNVQITVNTTSNTEYSSNVLQMWDGNVPVGSWIFSLPAFFQIIPSSTPLPTEKITKLTITFSSTVKNVKINLDWLAFKYNSENGNGELIDSFEGETTKIKNEEIEPKSFKLFQNYPNPFNPATIIQFNLPVASQVTLRVYDILGKEIALLVNGFIEAGLHSVSFDAGKFTNGVYVYKIEAGSFTQLKKMVLIK